MIRQTNSLRIEPMTESDVIHLYNWCYSGQYPEFFRDVTGAPDVEALQNYCHMRDGQGFMLRRHDLAPIGFAMLYEAKYVPAIMKLAIMLDNQYQDQGYCLEAVWSLAEFAFNRLRMHKLVLEAVAENGRIRDIADRAGFTEEARLVDESIIDGKYVDVVRYAVVADVAKPIIERLRGKLCHYPQQQGQPRQSPVPEKVQALPQH